MHFKLVVAAAMFNGVLACGPAPTALNAELLMDDGDVVAAERLARQVVNRHDADAEAAQRIIDELQLRRVMANRDVDQAMRDAALTWGNEHHGEQARAHVVEVLREAIDDAIAHKQLKRANDILGQVPPSSQQAVLPQRLLLVTAEAEACAATKMSNCATVALEQLHTLDATVADVEHDKLAHEAWDDEVLAWRRFNEHRLLSERYEACAVLRAATVFATAIDAEHHKKAHAEHIAACDRVVATWNKQADERRRRTEEDEARRQHEASVAQHASGVVQRSSAASSFTSFSSSSSSSSLSSGYGGYGGRQCKKGCACGGSCISCSKRCRH